MTDGGLISLQSKITIIIQFICVQLLQIEAITPYPFVCEAEFGPHKSVASLLQEIFSTQKMNTF